VNKYLHTAASVGFLFTLNYDARNLEQKFLFYNKFIICLYMFRAHVLIIRRSKLYYTASGIVTPVCDRPVRRLRQDCSVTIPDAV